MTCFFIVLILVSFLVFLLIGFAGVKNESIQVFPVARKIEFPEIREVPMPGDVKSIAATLRVINLLENELRHEIHIDSPIEQAQGVMNINRFTCKLVNNGNYNSQAISLSYETYVSKGTAHNHVNFLDCKITKEDLNNCIQITWNTYIEYKARKVTNLTVSASDIENPGFYDDYCRLEF
ncbi:MAG TPA: hypothetical protein V6C85_00275 [Allocoleopsis sp.]